MHDTCQLHAIGFIEWSTRNSHSAKFLARELHASVFLRATEGTAMFYSASTVTLLKKAARHPVRALVNSLSVTRLSLLNKARERDRLLRFLFKVFATDRQHLLESYEHSGLATRMKRKHAELNRFPGPFRLGAMQEFDCESLYFLVRALEPRSVVETGVCYGVSSAYILEALNQNGSGKLYSIDLGNTPDEPPNDFFVPRRLKNRWQLIIGDSKQELPPLLRRLGEIDLFLHDSLHTFEHMTWEYETALPHLSRDGALSSHDVRSVLGLGGVFKPNPFTTFCKRHKLRSIESFNTGIAVPRTTKSAVRLPSEPLKRRRLN